jgi:hypothetical protein
MLLAFPTPTNTTTVHSFIQSCQIVRTHNKNFAEMAQPLTRLIGTKTSFQWRDGIEGNPSAC